MERQTVTHWEVRRCDLPGDVGVLSWIGASITPRQSAKSLLLIAVSAAVSIPGQRPGHDAETAGAGHAALRPFWQQQSP
jgi:hypothetical protein